MVESVTASRAAGIIVVVLGSVTIAPSSGARTLANRSVSDEARGAGGDARATGKLRTPRTKGEKS
jgi:hypothetical protein